VLSCLIGIWLHFLFEQGHGNRREISDDYVSVGPGLRFEHIAMIPPARLFLITRFAELALQTVRASFVFYFSSQRLSGRTSHLYLLLLSSQDWGMAGVHGRVRTGLCSYIRLSARSSFLFNCDSIFGRLAQMIRRYQYTGCAWLRPGHIGRTTYVTGGFRCMAANCLGYLICLYSLATLGFSCVLCTVDASRTLSNTATPFCLYSDLCKHMCTFVALNLFSWLCLFSFNAFFLARAIHPLALIKVISMAP
jgi:hypothetical protein